MICIRTVLTVADCTAISRILGYGDTTNYVPHQIFRGRNTSKSYDMCTVPNLFKMNLFQQQRHVK